MPGGTFLATSHIIKSRMEGSTIRMKWIIESGKSRYCRGISISYHKSLNVGCRWILWRVRMVQDIIIRMFWVKVDLGQPYYLGVSMELMVNPPIEEWFFNEITIFVKSIAFQSLIEGCLSSQWIEKSKVKLEAIFIDNIVANTNVANFRTEWGQVGQEQGLANGVKTCHIATRCRIFENTS